MTPLCEHDLHDHLPVPPGCCFLEGSDFALAELYNDGRDGHALDGDMDSIGNIEIESTIKVSLESWLF